MKTISVMYYVKNEEEFLARSIESVVSFVDEIIVVDNKSTDKTPEIAQSFSKVKYQRIDGDFSTLGEDVIQTIAIKNCGCDWILRMDGDAVMSNGWRESVEPFLQDGQYGLGRIKFHEHVGSYELVQKGLDVMLMVFIRNHPQLEYSGGVGRMKVHGNFSGSAIPKKYFECKAATWFHYSYAKSDLMLKMINNGVRGDWGGNPPVPKTEFEALAMSQLVSPIPYDFEEVPFSMRDLFAKTYRVNVNNEGRIISREKW